MRRALIFGGTGAVGSALVRTLARRDVAVTFTWNQRRPEAEAEAQALIRQLVDSQSDLNGNPAPNNASAAKAERTAENEHSGIAQLVAPTAMPLDLGDIAATRTAIQALLRTQTAPDILIHTAVVAHAEPWLELSDPAWDESQRVGCQSLFAAVQELAPSLKARGGGDIIAVGGLDRAQSLPIPVIYAATQGMLSGLIMALAKQLGGDNVRINMVALGPLETGLSEKLDPALREAYLRFSAKRRLGTAAEAASAIAWLALNNRYMNGKVLPVNGGI